MKRFLILSITMCAIAAVPVSAGDSGTYGDGVTLAEAVESGNGVRIKVEDGVIVFPYTSMGHEAQAEGIFEAIKLTPEQIEARTAVAHGHEPGEACDKDATEGDGTGAGCDAPAVGEYVYMINGTGAVIKG
jgi:hypothetical protein